MNTVSIAAEARVETGKTGVKAVRASGLIPSIVYGNSDPKVIAVSLKDVRPLVYTPDFKIAELTMDGKTQKCILKDYQTHPTTEEILHIDFLRLNDDVPVKVDIPVRFKGTSPGVKVGGKLIQQMRKITIKALPKNLKDEIRVDISHLELGGVLRVRDIEADDSIEIFANPANPLATIEIPRALKSAAAAEAKAAKTAAKKK